MANYVSADHQRVPPHSIAPNKIPRDLKSYYSILSCQHPLCLKNSLPPEVSQCPSSDYTITQPPGGVTSSPFCVSMCLYGGFPGSSVGKESACSAGDLGSIAGSGRVPW